jgi:phage terminase large subunit
VQELGGGKTRVETLQSLGLRPRVLPQHERMDGINEVRKLLPRCWFDADTCKPGLEALRTYRREWDERRKCFHDRPLHDWSSAAADAFRYLAMGLREANNERMPRIRYDDRGIV